MGKLRLDIAELRVESFGTQLSPRVRGTVRGNSGECADDCGCTKFESCEVSCYGSCAAYHTCIPECETETCCVPCPLSGDPGC